MEKQIKAVLSGLPDVKVEQVANLWRVKIGGLSGAREDGVGLARELRAKYEYIRARERPVPVDIPVEIPAFMTFPDDPEPEPEAIRPDPRDEEIAALKAKLVEMEAVKSEEVPTELADLIEVADTPAEANAKLLAKWNEANGLIQIAHDRGERPPLELILKRDRLESGIRWNRGRLAEQI